MQTQYNNLSYRIDLYFHDYKPTIKNDESEHSDRSVDYEIRTQKAIKKNMVVNFLELILTKKTLIFLELSMKYLDTSNNQLKNSNE